MGGRVTKADIEYARREARAAAESERADAEALAQALERRDYAELVRAIAPAMGPGRHSAAIAEARRVRDMLARDKADRAAEAFRREAEVEFDAGKSVMMADAVVPPTPEQVASGEFRTYYPRQPDGATREVKTVRRVPKSRARKMMLWGVIDFEGFAACEWYSEIYERAGLYGHTRGSDFSREVFMMPHQRERFTDTQLEYQDLWRRIRPFIRSRHLRLLDQVVLQNESLHKAVRIARAFHRNPKEGFRQAVDQLVSARDKLGNH